MMPRSVAVLLALIVAVAAAARFWGLAFGLPHTNARPDETMIMDVVLQFLSGNFRPAFYDYPWVYMWSVTGLYLGYYIWGLSTGLFESLPDLVARWRTDWVPFFLMNRALSATLGTATVLVVFRLARTLWGNATALSAALFMAVAFLHARDSHYGTADVMMTFLLMSSLVFLVDAHLHGRPRAFLAAGLVGGLAVGTKYNAVLLLLPWFAVYAFAIAEASGRRVRVALGPALWLFGFSFAAGALIGMPFLLFDAERFLHAMEQLRESMQVGVGTLDLDPGWIHHLRFSLRHGLGLPLLVTGICGVILIGAAQPRFALILFSFPIAYYIVIGGVRNQFFRYALPLVPFLCIAAARSITMMVDASRHRLPGGGRSVLVSRALLVGLVAVIAAPAAASTFQFNRIMSRTDNRVVVARWFDQHVAAGSSVLTSGSPYGYVHFTRARHYNVWIWDRRHLVFLADFGKRPAAGRPDWILIQESPLPSATQPVVLDLLSEGYTLVRYFRAFTPARHRVYDRQDAFFAPFAGFRGVERPGPNFRLYQNTSAR